MVSMSAIWYQLSADTIKNCWKHTRLLDGHEEAEPLIDLTESGNSNANEEREEVENALAELVPARTRITVSELLETEEDEDCTD